MQFRMKVKRHRQQCSLLLHSLAILCAWPLLTSPLQAGDADAASIIAEGAALTLAASGYTFTEGPATDTEGNVYFTDQPNDRILKWSEAGGVAVFMEGAGRSNGLYFDHEGYLVACADEHNQLLRISPQQEVEILLADFEGHKFNGPNDAWVAADGGIYFTDPYYQREWWTRTEPEMESQNVYFLSPSGQVSIVDDDLSQPNGIIGSTTGQRLYVADIGAGITWVYDRATDGKLTNKREFAAMGSDGMTIDLDGNVYLTGDGVTVFNSAGEQIAHIAVDEDWTANVTFGGKDRNILFITAMDSVYTLDMAVTGAH
jgi:gluconolactonase